MWSMTAGDSKRLVRPGIFLIGHPLGDHPKSQAVGACPCDSIADADFYGSIAIHSIVLSRTWRVEAIGQGSRNRVRWDLRSQLLVIHECRRHPGVAHTND